MDLREYVRALRKSWWLVLLCVVVGVGVAAAYATTRAKTYTAQVRLFVSAPADTANDISGALSGSTFTQARVKSYADIVGTPEVTQSVIDRLHLDTTPTQLASELTASAPLNEVILNISVVDRDPRRASAIANAVGQRMTVVVNALEAPESGGPSPVKLSVVQPAGVPRAATSPKTKLDLALGFLVGLAVGVGAAVMRLTFDRSVHGQDDIQTLVGLNTLGAIAYDGEAGKRPLVVQVSPHSHRAEAFRQLRTNLQFIDVDNPPKSLVVTSAVPREGKSTTTTNLALTFAQSGLNVLLLEGDLRRPRVTRYVGLPDNLPGLTDALVGKAQLEDVIVPFNGMPGLSILPAGANPPNPSELLSSQNMVNMLAELRRRFDIVVIDAPPLLPVTDGAVLGSIADGTIVVVRAGKTTKEQLRRAVEALNAIDVRTIGAVLNMVPTKGPDASAYGYGYGYGNGYGGNYSTYGDKPGKGETARPKLDDDLPVLAPAARLGHRQDQLRSPLAPISSQPSAASATETLARRRDSASDAQSRSTDRTI